MSLGSSGIWSDVIFLNVCHIIPRAFSPLDDAITYHSKCQMNPKTALLLSFLKIILKQKNSETEAKNNRKWTKNSENPSVSDKNPMKNNENPVKNDENSSKNSGK